MKAIFATFVSVSMLASLALAAPLSNKIGIHITGASYGVVGGSGDNAFVTKKVAEVCEGTVDCIYAVDFGILGDPAPGQHKGFSVAYDCNGISQPPKNIAAEADKVGVVRLQCPAKFPQRSGIHIVNAKYGENCPNALPVGYQENVTRVVRQSIGYKVQFHAAYNIDFHAFSNPCSEEKAFSVKYECYLDGRLLSRKSEMVPREAHGKSVIFQCPTSMPQ